MTSSPFVVAAFLPALLTLTGTGQAAAQLLPETVLIPFTGGSQSATTAASYAGEVWLCVRGTGRAAGPKLSDAFFVFTGPNGALLPPPGVIGTDEAHPWHSTLQWNWVLAINSRTADEFIIPARVPTLPSTNVPEYNPSHVYAFPIEAPGGPLVFGVNDEVKSDNTGAYVITLGTRSQALACFAGETASQAAIGYVWGSISLSSNQLFNHLQAAGVYLAAGNDAAARVELTSAEAVIRANSGAGIDTDYANLLLSGVTYLLRLI